MLKPSSCSKLSLNNHYRNAFGLPRIKTCPGKTSLCERVCYSQIQERLYPLLLPMLEENLWSIQDTLAMGDIQELSEELAAMVKTPEFRIHWGGDFFSREYTQAWAMAIRLLPDVHFWAYTRSFEYVPLLAELPNLRLYLSLDQENYVAGYHCHRDNPWTLISTMGMIPERLYPGGCPEFDDLMTWLMGMYPTIHWFNCPAVKGPLKEVRGACLKCRVCVSSRSQNIVNFPIHR